MRAIASFMPAFAVGVIFWNNGGTSALVLGLILGFVLSCFVMFLLFKLQPTHLAAAAGYALGTFAFGVVIAGGVLFGLNYGLTYTLDKVHKIDMVPVSPIAAGFPWPLSRPSPQARSFRARRRRRRPSRSLSPKRRRRRPSPAQRQRQLASTAPTAAAAK